jgi:hypothetical protein
LLIYISEATPPSRTVAHAKRAFAAVNGPPVADEFTPAIGVLSMPYTGSAGQFQRVTYVYLADDGRPSTEVFQDIEIS